MSKDEVLPLILDRLNAIDDKIEKLREHHSLQMSRVHKRIDDTDLRHNADKEVMTERHNEFRVECKKNDTQMERRIGVVGTAAALITSLGVKVLELIFQFIPRLFK